MIPFPRPPILRLVMAPLTKARLALVMTLAVLAFVIVPAKGAFAQNQDFVSVNGRLSDLDFYHLATCGARPDGDCEGPYVRWRAGTLSVAILEPEPGFPKAKAKQLSRALDRAIAEINGVGSGIRLARRDQFAGRAQIVVTPTALVTGDRTKALTNVAAGAQMGVGYMSIYWNTNGRIMRGGIAIAADIGSEEMDSVVLEELFQTLGFIHDIDSPSYEGVSILSESSNQTTRIKGQDRKTLLMHYPPG